MIISIDQGTTSCRAILFNEKAQSIATAQNEFTQFFPKSGWVEHDPIEILECQLKVINDLFEENNIDQIKTIGITNQRETIVAWNKKTGKPIYNAIVWQDTRTSDYCNNLKKKGYEPLIKDKTGLLLDSYFSASKMNWIIRNVPEASDLIQQKNLLFGTIDSWLIWNLSEEKNHFTDVSNASRTLLFNINDLTWDDELLEIFEIPLHTLPTIKESAADFGTFNKEGVKIPIQGVIGDQQAALFGQCCFESGQAKNTYGTGCFMLMNTGSSKIESSNGLISTIGWSVNNQVTYALEGSVFVAGAGVQWLRDGLYLIKSASETEELSKKAKESSLVFVPAFVGLGAPHWDMNARGLLIGLTRDTTSAEISRATLEAMAYQTKDVLNAMELDSGIELKELKVDGGACVNSFLMQFQADILNKKVDRPICTESTALGAALLAGIQAKMWTLEKIKQLRASEVVFLPSNDRQTFETKYSRWNKAVERCKDWE
ncbi:MAG: glycerol kinase [Flavobacteriales bacterium]|jgi:glycerol kinase